MKLTFGSALKNTSPLHSEDLKYRAQVALTNFYGTFMVLFVNFGAWQCELPSILVYENEQQAVCKIYFSFFFFSGFQCH